MFDISKNIQMLKHLFNKEDLRLLLVIFITSLVYLTLTTCKCIKRHLHVVFTSNHRKNYHKDNHHDSEINHEKITKILKMLNFKNPFSPLH